MFLRWRGACSGGSSDPAAEDQDAQQSGHDHAACNADQEFNFAHANPMPWREISPSGVRMQSVKMPKSECISVPRVRNVRLVHRVRL